MTAIAPREEPYVSKPVASPVRHEPAGDDLIELLFFAYRDFVGDPDRILSAYGFGRAHHRVLHFVDRYPGLTIAELLDILRITKQSLNRVLKDLIGQGYVTQRPGESDRRQRLLSCTESGAALAADLTRVQARRLARAMGTALASLHASGLDASHRITTTTQLARAERHVAEAVRLVPGLRDGLVRLLDVVLAHAPQPD